MISMASIVDLRHFVRLSKLVSMANMDSDSINGC